MCVQSPSEGIQKGEMWLPGGDQWWDELVRSLP